MYPHPKPRHLLAVLISTAGLIATSLASTGTLAASPTRTGPPAHTSPCPSQPGKASLGGAACTGQGTPADLTAPTISLPTGSSQCPPESGKASSAGAACGSATPAAQPAPVTGTVSGTHTSTKPTLTTQPRAPTGLASDLPGYSVSLYESTNALPPGHGITLSAYASLDVGPTPYWLEIYDQSTGGLVARCAYGSSCSGSSVQYAPTTHSFIAYIGSYSDYNPPASIAATSNTVYCTWLSVSLYASPQYSAPGTGVRLTAYANTDVGPTPYWLEIFDTSTGANLAICASGSSCAGSETQYVATVHSFAAYISGYGTGNPPPSVQVSAGTSAVWFGISLAASAQALGPGGSTTLTASTNADVGPSPYWISIFDQTTGSRVALCATGTSCSVTITQSGSTIRDYAAFVSSSSTTYPPSSIQASSNSVRVTWISVTLGATATFLAPGGTTTLVANASLDVGPTAYSITVSDQTAGVVVFQCGTGTTCTGSTSQASAGIHSYVATVGNPYTTRATSNLVKVTWLSVSLGVAGTGYQLAGSSMTLTATANADISTSPYAFELEDQTAGQNVKECRLGASCSVAVSNAAGTHTFIAYLSVPDTAYPPLTSEIQATSGTLSAVWVVDCTGDNSCTPNTFADDIFVYPGINAPATAANEFAMRVWERREGGGAGCPGQAAWTAPWAYSGGPAGNPINTTQWEPGSSNWNSVGVKIFSDNSGHTCWFWGVKANGDTLLNGYYGPILSALRNPVADSYNQCVRLAQAVGSTPWGTGNFQSSCTLNV